MSLRVDIRDTSIKLDTDFMDESRFARSVKTLLKVALVSICLFALIGAIVFLSCAFAFNAEIWLIPMAACLLIAGLDIFLLASTSSYSSSWKSSSWSNWNWGFRSRNNFHENYYIPMQGNREIVGWRS